MNNRSKPAYKEAFVAGVAMLLSIWGTPPVCAYTFNEIVPDVRQPAALSGGSACPVRSHQLTGAGAIALRWSTVLNTNPVTVLTQNQTASGQLAEIEQVIMQSIGVWTGVSGTTLLPSSVASLSRTATSNACGADGLNSICFDQADAAFTPGVLAFTRVVTADLIGLDRLFIKNLSSAAAGLWPSQTVSSSVLFSLCPLC